MDFWSLIGSNELIDSGSADRALGLVRERLRDVTTVNLIQFADRVAEACYRLDRREFAEVPFRLQGESVQQTNDDFLGFRLSVVLSGQKAFQDVLEGRLAFENFVKPGLSGDSLLYLAGEVYGARTGKSFTYTSEYDLDAGSNHQGWPDTEASQ